VEFGRLAIIVGAALAFGLLDLVLGTGWWTMLLWVIAAWPVVALESSRSVARTAVGQCETVLMQVSTENEQLRNETAVAAEQPTQAQRSRSAELAGDKMQRPLVAYLAKSPALETDFPKHLSDLRSAVGEARNAETFLRHAAIGGEVHAARVAALVDHVESFLSAVDATA
jgi:hypothetical protein